MDAADSLGGAEGPGDAAEYTDGETGLDIDRRILLAAFAGGAAGLAAMVPVLLGLPALFGLFQAEPLVNVAEFGRVVGVEPNLLVGVAVFVLGGTVALPLLFVIAGSFLPPREPRLVRGATFATIMWTGFVIAFWPGAEAAVLFAGLSLFGHWIYGLVLGAVMERLASIPQHTL